MIQILPSFVALAALTSCDPASVLLQPRRAFHAADLAAAPVYAEPAAWAAHPDQEDRADLVPVGVQAEPAAAADVFFVYPTAWFDREVWNDTLDNPQSREIVDQITMAGEASVFNGCCRVYAPRYRQATLGAFYGEPDDAQRAFSIAYEDVDRAFSAFLDEIGDRPFLIAGHSQGSMHAMRLLERVHADPDLRERLVVAYLVGYAHPLSNLETAYPSLAACEEPEQVGCVAAWDTYRAGARAAGHEPMLHWRGGEAVSVGDAPRQCTNPISWRQHQQPTATSDHRGAVASVNDGEPVVLRKMMMSGAPMGVSIEALGAPRAGFVSAWCEDGALRVPDVKALGWPTLEVQPGNYHLMDYELFYMDIRDNAIARVRAWERGR